MPELANMEPAQRVAAPADAATAAEKAAQYPSLRAERIIRRTEVQTVHQAVAFDALARLPLRDADLWQRLLLGEAHALAQGASAPDREFRDFKNHVLFPATSDGKGGWGGAADRAQAWTQNLTTALKNLEWHNAAYCAGVLCHYLTDALHPFHTGQSTAENDCHFALDAAVWLAYPELARQGAASAAASLPELVAGRNFLVPALSAGAATANADRATLLAHFDLQRARRNAVAGFDGVSRQVMAATIARATALFAAVLGRAINNAGSAPPVASLASAVLRAELYAPVALVAKRWHAARLQRIVGKMAKEHAATGRVIANLPDEERIKHDAYSKAQAAASEPETAPPQSPASAAAAGDNVLVFGGKPASPPRESDNDGDPGEVIDLNRRRRAVEPPRPAPRPMAAEPIRRWVDVKERAAAQSVTARVVPPAAAAVTPGAVLPAAAALADASGADLAFADGVAIAPTFNPAAATRVTAAGSRDAAALGHAAAALLAPTSVGGLSNFRDRRATTPPATVEISAPSPVGPAPPTTAGLSQFRADARDVASRVNDPALAKSVIGTLQHQARLTAAIADLADQQAQLLIGAGYVTPQAIAEAGVEKLCTDVLTFAMTPAGQRLLQDRPAPDITTVRRWTEAARAARVA